MRFPKKPELEELDCVAADSRRLGPARLAAAAVVIPLVAWALGLPTAAAWGALLLGCEAWMWTATGPQSRGEPTSSRRRLSYAASAVSGCLTWLSLALAFWRSPGSGGPFLAMLVWAALMLNAISFAFRSRFALIMFSAPVGLAMTLTPLLVPRFTGAQQALTAVGLPLVAVYAAMSAWRNVRAAAELASTGAALDEARRAAEAASAAKSSFLATVSHEIRTPLNGVLGMAQAMAADELSTVQRDRLDVVSRSGAALLAMLNDILDLAKIEAGKLDLEAGDFALGELALGAHAAFTEIANARGLSFDLTLSPEAHGLYRGDSTRIRQILYNLISNALKFTAEGQVRVSVGRVEDELTIAVADTGCGVAPEALEGLFGKFVQADATTTRRFGGTGLGLSICRELCDLMGGRIWAESELGSGSTFHVRIPARRLGDEPARPAPAAPPQARPDLGLRVLAAEDNAVNQLVLRTLLHQAGVDPVVVPNGRAAVEAWAREAWDVILMDVQMPEMDGPAATREIRAREARESRPRTPIIALTANAMAHHRSEYLAAGMDGLVAKPIQFAELIATLQSVLDDEECPLDQDAA